MYKGALIQVAEWLEAGAPHKGTVSGFNMCYHVGNPDELEIGSPLPDCGTACCIAGAIAQFNSDNEVYKEWPDVYDFATDVSGITGKEAATLFECAYSSVHLTEVTAPWAARTLRHFIATGVVDWESNRPEAEPDTLATGV